MNAPLLPRLIAVSLLLGAGCSFQDDLAPPYSLDGFDLPGEDFYPEGVAVAPDGSFYVGSLGTGKIARLAPGEATVVEFSPRDTLDTAVGMVVDEALDTLWVCDASLSEAASAIVGLSLSNGSELVRHAFPAPPALCNDLALDDAGNLYATDSFAPRILRIAADRKTQEDSAEEWVADPIWAVEPGQFGLNGIAVHGADLWVAHTQQNALYHLMVTPEGMPGAVTRVALDRTPNGLDGLEATGDDTLIFAEGYANSLTEIALGADGTGTLRVVTSQLDGPTTFALFAGSAWVAEGQLDSLFDPSAPEPTLPFRVTRVELP